MRFWWLFHWDKIANFDRGRSKNKFYDLIKVYVSYVLEIQMDEIDNKISSFINELLEFD